MVEDSLESEESADRRAIEAILGRPLDGEWPVEAMKPGTRVRIVKDESWDGPWRDVFTGSVDTIIPPQPVRHRLARSGELEYSVRFDEPQFDAAGDGPFRKAVIWARYLETF